jgi:hypothetical protein
MKNVCCYTSTPPYAFIAQCLIKHKDSFTFSLISASHSVLEDGEGMVSAYCDHAYPRYQAPMYAHDRTLFDDAFCHCSRADNS